MTHQESESYARRQVKKKIYGAWMVTEAKFLVPDEGMKSILAEGCRTGPLGSIDWQAEMTTICNCRLFNSGRD